MSEFRIYTDGGYSIPRGVGGYAYVVVKDGNIIDTFRTTEKSSTSARMEIKAFIKALEYAKEHLKDQPVLIYTDNDYVVQGYNTWSKNWKANNWKRTGGGTVKNIELWKQIEELRSDNITSKWIKGHNGDEFNELVDSMTRDYLKEEVKEKSQKTGLGATEIFFVSKYKVKGISNYATVKECVDYIKELDLVGLDIETSRKFKEGTYSEQVYKGGLDPYLSNVIMIQVGDLIKSFVIDVRDFTKKELKSLIKVLDWNDKITFVGHNLKFEGKHLLHNYNIRLKNVYDTMITEINLTNGMTGMKYGLADLASKYLGIEGKKEAKLFEDLVDRKKVTLNDLLLEENAHLFTPFEIESNFYIDKSTRLQFIKIGSKPFNKKQILYGSDDIILPILIKERQRVGVQISPTENYYPEKLIRVENTFTQVLADIENNGMSFVLDKWIALADKNEIEFNNRVKVLNKYVTHHYPETSQGNLFRPEADCAIEWASSKQVIYLFRRIGICPKEYSKETKKIDFTVGATALVKLLPNNYKEVYFKNKWIGFEEDEKGNFKFDTDRLIVAYLLVKKTHQSITTFGRDWVKYVHPVTNRIHPNFRQILNTGRLSSSNPNLLNVSGGEFRKCFQTAEGFSMINNDYAAQEIRILADKSEDPLFVSFFTEGDEFYGEDFHAYTATKVFSIMRNDESFVVPPKELPITGESNSEFTEEHQTMRDYAKKVNFGIAYGKGSKGFSEDFGMSIEDADKLINSYLEVYEGLDAYFKRQRKKAGELPYIQIDTYLDRRWFFPKYREMMDIYDDIWEHFPDNYITLPSTVRDAVKAEIYSEFPDLKDKWRAYFLLRGQYERKLLNYPIQGTASSILKIGMCGLRKDIVENGYDDFKLTNLVHDEVLAESPNEKAKPYGELMSKWMIQGGKYLCKSVPMVADYKIGDVWGH